MLGVSLHNRFTKSSNTTIIVSEIWKSRGATLVRQQVTFVDKKSTSCDHKPEDETLPGFPLDGLMLEVGCESCRQSVDASGSSAVLVFLLMMM